MNWIVPATEELSYLRPDPLLWHTHMIGENPGPVAGPSPCPFPPAEC